MSIYAINEASNTIGIGAFICLEFTDSESLQKKFAILNAAYRFIAISITTDFAIKSFKIVWKF